jgi:hypothetical protein
MEPSLFMSLMVTLLAYAFLCADRACAKDPPTCMIDILMLIFIFSKGMS